MAEFNLADVLSSVSKSGTGGREQIEYIDIDLLDDDPNNFYELSGLEELAENIELFGLQQPLRVRPGEGDRVIIVSGHRRRAAIRILVSAGQDDLRLVPCIRDKADGSDALQELRLIYANSDTRRLTSAEISRQAERVEALLYQLKEEGYDFPGRMRDHVAEACKVSKTKLANLKVIREGLDEKTWLLAWEKGKVADSVALIIARLPKQDQLRCWSIAKKKRELSWYREYEAGRDAKFLRNLCKLKCPRGGSCQLIDQKFAASKVGKCDCEEKCCGNCGYLAFCDFACPVFADKVKRLKAERREEGKQKRLKQEKIDRPEVEGIAALWKRFAEARIAAGLDLNEYLKKVNVHYVDDRTKKNWPIWENGEKLTKNSGVPFFGGTGFSYYDVKRLRRMADVLGVSLDYLFCREYPLFAGTPETVGWSTGTPTKNGTYAVWVNFGGGAEYLSIYRWKDGEWLMKNVDEPLEVDAVCWLLLPEKEGGN